MESHRLTHKSETKMKISIFESFKSGHRLKGNPRNVFGRRRQTLRWRAGLAMVLSMAGLASGVWPAAGQESKTDKPLSGSEQNVEQGETQQWAGDLSSPSFEVREKATASLKNAGFPATQAVVSLLNHPDSEVAWRARDVFLTAGMLGNDEQITRIESILKLFVVAGHSEFVKDASQFVKMVQRTRSDKLLNLLNQMPGLTVQVLSGQGANRNNVLMLQGNGMMFADPGVKIFIDGELVPLPGSDSFNERTSERQAQEDAVAESSKAEMLASSEYARQHLGHLPSDILFGSSDQVAQIEATLQEKKVLAAADQLMKDQALEEFNGSREDVVLAMRNGQIGQAFGGQFLVEERGGGVDRFVIQIENVNDRVADIHESVAALKEIAEAKGLIDLTLEHVKINEKILSTLTELVENQTLQSLQTRQCQLDEATFVHLRQLTKSSPAFNWQSQGRALVGIFGPQVFDRNGQGQQAIISSVSPGSGAEAAGLLPNDVILKINDVEVESFDDLKQIVSIYAPEEVITIKVRRAGESKPLDFKVTLTESNL